MLSYRCFLRESNSNSSAAPKVILSPEQAIASLIHKVDRVLGLVQRMSSSIPSRLASFIPINASV